MIYGMGYGYGGLFLIFAILAMIAQSNVNSTFSKYSKVANRRGYTGADVARMLLESANVYDVRVEAVGGNLTDHFDPRENVIRLSEGVYNSKSVAALGVAAHETGHAIQHSVGYFPLSLRNSIFPIVSFSSKVAMPIIILGLVFSFLSSSYIIIQAGILLFSFVVFFQLVTLPVELNASSRAINMLTDYNFLDQDEVAPAKKVLGAAALTYVAAAALAILQLLRLLSLLNRRR